MYMTEEEDNNEGADTHHAHGYVKPSPPRLAVRIEKKGNDDEEGNVRE